MKGDRQKILIVDDRPENLFALEKVLGGVDADIIRAGCGNDALIASLNHGFALALLDVQMPGMDGYELAEYLRDNQKTKNLPIIFLTAVYSDDHHVFKGYEAGAVDFVTKPYRSEILLAKVKIFLQLDRQRRDLERTLVLETAKNHLENILLSMIDAVLVVSRTGMIQTVNDAAVSLLGYASGEITGMPFAGLFEGGVLPAWAMTDNPAYHQQETCLMTKYGEPISVAVSGSIFHDRDDRVLGTVVVARDIRERIQAQKTLKASEEKFRTLYETSKEGIAFLDMDGNFREANRAFLDMVGYRLHELAGMNCRQLGPDSRNCVEAASSGDQAMPGEYPDAVETGFTKKDASVFPVAVRRWVSRDEAGKPAGIWMLLRDLTEQKALEQQRIMTEKITALGMLAGGMAHELNNPMMGIHCFLEYCLKHTPQGDRCHEVLEDARQETKRCMDLVQNLLTFSHQETVSEEACQWVDCGVLLDRVLSLLAYRIVKDNVLVTREISDDCREIQARGNTLQQVVLNLMTNALDAVGKSPTREIRCEVRPCHGKVLIAIADTGCGILPEHVSLIFDPFFTTKPVGKGTGLGLSVSKSIIESHGGTLRCESRPGKGTRVEVLLPLNPDQGINQEVNQ